MNPWTDAERHARRAHRYYESGRWRMALSELQRAIEKDPEQAEWYVGLGLTLEALNRFDEAADAFRIVTELREDDKDAWIHLGVNELRNNHAHQAIAALNHATDLDRNAVAPYSHRVLAYAMLGDHDQAELQFYFAINLADRPCATAFDHLAHSLALRGRFREGAETWIKCLKIDPTYPDAQACMARALWRDGQLDAAVHAFRRHLALEHEDTQAWIDLAQLQRARNDHRAALLHLGRVVEIDPGSEAAWQALGDVHAELDQPAKALQAYENATILAPGRPGVRLGLAQIHAARHEREQTLQLLAQELACDNQKPEELVAIAELFARFDAPGRAASLVTSVLNDDSIELSDELLLACLFLRAKCAANAGLQTAVIADLRQITRLTPTQPDAWARLAEAYAQLQRYDRAAVALRRAQSLSPDHDGSLAKLQHRIRKRRFLKHRFLKHPFLIRPFLKRRLLA